MSTDRVAFLNKRRLEKTLARKAKYLDMIETVGHGKNYKDTARKLNEAGLTTEKGGQFHATTVRNLFVPRHTEDRQLHNFC